MDPCMQTLEIVLKVCLIVPPCQAVHSRCRVLFEFEERLFEVIGADVVQERGELLLCPLPCYCAPAPVTRLPVSVLGPCCAVSHSPRPLPLAPPTPRRIAPRCSPASQLLRRGLTSHARASSATAPHLPDADLGGQRAHRSNVRPPRFRRVPFVRDVFFDQGRASVPRIAGPHMLPSTLLTGWASAVLWLSRLNGTPHTIAVYASHPPSPATTQHSLPGARYGLPGPVSHRQDHASFPGAQAIHSSFTRRDGLLRCAR